MHCARQIVTALIVTIAVTAFLPLAASAHEVREVLDGKYRMVVGFLDEPAFTGFKNGLDLRVTDNPAGEDVERVGIEGLETTLQAEVIYGDQRMELELRPRWRDPGAYNGYLIPTAPGDYTFRIWGTINGEEIDESFTSSPEGFDSVKDSAAYEFPKQTASSEGVVAGTIAGGDGSGSGGILGALGLVVGAAGLWLARRHQTVRQRRALAPSAVRAGIGD